MTKRFQVYKCNICGNITEVLHPGKGQLVCCGQPMLLLAENTVDASREKHVPVVTWENGQIRVQVGSALHPMDPDHYIEWIEVITEDQTDRRYLSPGANPEVLFTDVQGAAVVRSYCNLHGLWKVDL